MVADGRKPALGPDADVFNRAIADAPKGFLILRLYVSGMTARSQRAIDQIQQLCAQYLAGRHELQVIDIYQQPELAKEQQIIAAPTLVKKFPLPLRKIVGEMADPGRILLVLGVTPELKGGKL